MKLESPAAGLVAAASLLVLVASCGTGIRTKASFEVDAGDVENGDVGGGDVGEGDAESGDTESAIVGSEDARGGDVGNGDVDSGDAGSEDDGDGETFVRQTVDGRLGGVLQLQEATLEVCKGCLSGEATIVLRRYESISHLGAHSPVFEIELPSPDTFINDPKISIATTSPPPKAVIGFLISNDEVEQWIPDSPATPPVCDDGVVCGPVQTGSFTNPQNSPANATTKVMFAIIHLCDSTSECDSQEACSSRACQECQAGSECNP
jgi:hypothetical protein